MPSDLLNPSVCRENALNALAEIRACHGDLRTYVAGAFDRLDGLVEELGTQKTDEEQTQRQVDQASMQEQIDRLARLATELAQSVAEQKRLTTK
jgi:ribosome assembly protein YihI (activator of Der GTPase)